MLAPTGLRADLPLEKMLPRGAALYVRANNTARMIANLDRLFKQFIPEKALPDDLKPLLSSPQPVLGLLGKQSMGHPLTIEQLSGLAGVDLNREASLAMYANFMGRDFIVAIPVSNFTALTSLMHGILKPKVFKKETFDGGDYFRLRSSLPEFHGEDMYVFCSEKTAYFCSSPDAAEILTDGASEGDIGQDLGVARSIAKFQDRDLVVTVTRDLIEKQILPFLTDMLNPDMVLSGLNDMLGEAIASMPPAERAYKELMLDLYYDIKGFDQLAAYADAASSVIYRHLFEYVKKSLSKADGLALALNFDEKLQRLAFTVFARDLDPAGFAKPIPLAEVKEVLKVLPGEKTYLSVLGRAPENQQPGLGGRILDDLNAEFTKRGLPVAILAKLKAAYSQKDAPNLESMLDWTLTGLIEKPGQPKPVAPQTIREWLKALFQSSAFSNYATVAVLPNARENLLEDHYGAEAKAMTTPAATDPTRPIILETEGRFSKQNLDNGLNKLVFEKIFKLNQGMFGYQQHELISRKILYSKKLDKVTLAFDGLDQSQVQMLLGAAPSPAPNAILRLLDQLPPEVNSIHLARSLHGISSVLAFFSNFEDVAHQDLTDYLAKAKQIVDSQPPEAWPVKLAALEMPIPVASLHVDKARNPYCLLPGGLVFPRAKIMPEVLTLFKDYLTVASDLGGGAVYTWVKDNEINVSMVQGTESLAFMIRTVLNNFFDRYINDPAGQGKLMTLAGKSAKGPDELKSEEVLANPLWMGRDAGHTEEE